MLNARAAVLQDALGRFINAKLVTEHNDKLENLADKATRKNLPDNTRKFRAGQRVRRKLRGRSKNYYHGVVMHVNADGKLPQVTVLWMMHDGKLEDERGTEYVDKAEINKLGGYRKNFTRPTKDDPQCISYEQLRDTWCAHLSLSPAA